MEALKRRQDFEAMMIFEITTQPTDFSAVGRLWKARVMNFGKPRFQ